MENPVELIRIGTRGSKLALVQTNLVIENLKQVFPNVQFEVVVIKTTGDKILDKPLLEFGGKGVFVSEFEEALLNDEIDLAVHSSKDMPMELSESLEICGVLKREDPRDVLITRKNMDSLSTIGTRIGTRIGTSSLRRQIQVSELYQNIDCQALRGNIDTRLKKLEDGMYDGIILAAAGIKRLHYHQEDKFNYRYFSFDEMVPAGGQGIIAIEGRKNSDIGNMVKTISDHNTFIELEVERKAMKLFQADCNEPIGIIAQINDDLIQIQIMRAVNDRIIKKQKTAALSFRYELLDTLVKEILEES